MNLLKHLRDQAGVRSLLSDVNSNPKIKKNGKLGVLTAVLHLAPGDMSGHEVCPKRSAGCTAACLHFAGSPAYATAKNVARLKRTRLFFENRDLFMNILVLEIAQHIRRAARKNMEAAFRLNGTSDIVWEVKRFNIRDDVLAAAGLTARKFPTITELFPSESFYDYTAILQRTPPPNYHLTFSLKEHNMNEAYTALGRGWNVAAVFEGGLPTSFMNRPVLDGDEHDYRPADPTGHIVGLKVKGIKGRADQSGFVMQRRQTPGDLLAA
jgi:hypothetical protein